MARVISFVIGYFFGCILTAEIVARHYTGQSARQIGTGNPGMANIMANLGKGPGFLVLAGDILKTGIPVLLCGAVFGKAAGVETGRICMQYAGLGAVCGHNFPLWKRGKGGKGVAVTCTWMIVGFAIPGLICDLLGAAVVFLTGWLPLAAVVITVAAVPMAFLTMGTEAGMLALISCGLMFSRHWHGLRRILRGEEKENLKLLGRRHKKRKEERDEP